MKANKRSYYLQQLNIPHWCERLSSLVQPEEMYIPNNPKILFIVHLPIEINDVFKLYLLQIASALDIEEAHMAYAIFKLTKEAQLDLSQLYLLLDNKNIVVVILDNNSMLKDIIAYRPNLCVLDTQPPFIWDSAQAKKSLMNMLLENELLT
jgi:hypothetical protein